MHQLTNIDNSMSFATKNVFFDSVHAVGKRIDEEWDNMTTLEQRLKEHERMYEALMSKMRLVRMDMDNIQNQIKYTQDHINDLAYLQDKELEKGDLLQQYSADTNIDYPSVGDSFIPFSNDNNSSCGSSYQPSF